MFFLLIPIIIAVAFVKLLKPSQTVSLKGRHVVVTGGSSGIGKACAVFAAQKGAHVTIIARNIEKLAEAAEEIKNHVISDEQIISKVSVDIVHYEDVENNLSELEEIVGPIFMLVNCAGMAICGKIEDYTEQQIKTLIDVNFLGSIYAVKAIVPKFKKRKEGIIVLTASQLGLLGMYGMSAYAACKFALRGLAESLHMELKDYNISVTLSLPPDTDTPGLAEENKTKPKETKVLCATSGLVKPEEVANKLMNDALVSLVLINVIEINFCCFIEQEILQFCWF